MKIINVAVIGCGNRGKCYTELILKQPDKFKITAICDTSETQLENMKILYNLNTDAFLSEEEFLKELKEMFQLKI